MGMDVLVDGRVLRLISGLLEPRLIVIGLRECDALKESGNEMREHDGDLGLGKKRDFYMDSFDAA
jgi:hypothetical protein